MSSASKSAATTARATIVIRREFDVSEGDAFNQVLIQRAKRRLEALDFFDTVEISTAPGSRARPGHSRRRRGREVDRRILDRRRLYDGRRYARTVDRRLDHRAQLPRPRPVHPLLGRRRQELARLHSCPSPSPISSAGASPPASTSSGRRAPTTTTRAMTTGGTIRFGLPITEDLSTQIAYNLSQEEYEFDDDCDRRTACSIRPMQRLAGDHRRRGRTARGSSRRSVGTLIYNTIDDIKNPHSGIYANVDRRGRRPRRRRAVREG